MSEVTNWTKELLSAGKVSVGIGIRTVRGAEVARVMKTAGFDFLFIDLEHGPMSVESAYSVSVAALSAEITPIVRVPHMDLRLATRCLDGGALGIVVPHVDTVEEARAVVDALRFAPLGHRSIAGGYPQFAFAAKPAKEAVSILNAMTLVVVMIETPRAVENAEAIAAVPGIDALLVGTNDLSLEMGIPGEITHPRVASAIDTVVSACKKHGKHAALGGVYAKPQLEPYLARGVRMILAGTDLGLLLNAGTEQARFIRGLG